MAANLQLTQTDANALCSKGLSHTCSDRWIPVVGMLDAACCEMHCTVSLNHISHTRYVPDGVSVLLRCFARERLAEEMRRVQAPQSSRNNNSNSNKKRAEPARAVYHYELRANHYNQCSLCVMIFICRQDASVSSFPSSSVTCSEPRLTASCPSHQFSAQGVGR